MTTQERDIKRKLAVLKYAEGVGNIALACRHFGISRQCFYNRRRAFVELECQLQLQATP